MLHNPTFALFVYILLADCLAVWVAQYFSHHWAVATSMSLKVLYLMLFSVA